MNLLHWSCFVYYHKKVRLTNFYNVQNKALIFIMKRLSPAAFNIAKVLFESCLVYVQDGKAMVLCDDSRAPDHVMHVTKLMPRHKLFVAT